MIILRNEKGFSLIEMIAVLFIASVVLLPLLVGLTGNIRVNNTQIDKSIASQISVTTIQTFEEMNFNNLYNTWLNSYTDWIDNPSENGIILRLSSDLETDQCSALSSTMHFTDFFQYESNQSVCQQIFEIKSINRSFDSDEFMVFIYPFSYDVFSNPDDKPSDLEARILAEIESLDNDGFFPIDAIRDEIEKDVNVNNPSRFRMLRVIVWIQYGENQSQSIWRTSLLLPAMEWD